MLYSIVGMLVIILDQGVKFWVTNHIMVNTVTEPLIPGVISLVRMHNDGAAFSFLAGGGARIYFIILTGIFTVAVIIALATNFISGRFGRWCLVLVTAGGLSNCLDRVLYGYVVDMFKVELFNFAVFNVADIFITVFCLLFIVYIIFGGEDEKEDLSEFDDDDEDLDRPSFRAELRASRREAKAGKIAATTSKREKKRGAKYEEEDDRFAEQFGSRRRSAKEDRAPRREKPVSADRAAASSRDRAPVEGRGRGVPAGRAAVEQPERGAPNRAARSGRSRYEEEYEAFMSSRPDARAEVARKAAPSAKAQSDDPFAAWERANAKVESRQNSGYTAKAMGVARTPAESEPERAKAPARAPAAADEELTVKAPPASPQQPSAAAAPARPAPKASDDLDFSLDDILSEFR